MSPMPVRINPSSVFLFPVTLSNLGQVWEFAEDRLRTVGIHIHETQMPTVMYQWLAYCRVVFSADGEIYCLIYPDVDKTTDKILSVHAILSPKAARRRRDQELMLCQYIDHYLHNESFDKIEIECVEKYPLIMNLAERLGFKKEGIRRQAWYEADQAFDVHLYGLLKEEWKDLNR